MRHCLGDRIRFSHPRTFLLLALLALLVPQ
jgi:hypothetical protein